ncbi:MAG: glycoside hydrolase family 31 protein [Planctomycetota bacterium]|jgi:alpha-glucosidase (family GH31 glycosyl hydrolase)|nr:glycoside hydrolase family 31 protein [Planctomycetota bacterium]
MASPDAVAGDPARRPELPWPEWAWSHWVWEDESTQESALALVDGYLERDIPVGAIIIDSPWETAYGSLEWDPERFPDPRAMIARLHEQGVRVMVWIVPVVNVDTQPLYSEGCEEGFFMQRGPDGAPARFEWWKGTGSLIDLWNPRALAWWRGRLDRVLDLGVDGWKCDAAEYNAYLHGAAYSPGLGKKASRLEYSRAYTGGLFRYTRERLGDDRIITARPIDNYGFRIGGDLVAFSERSLNRAGWVGDQDATFRGLRAALDNMYCSAEYGYLAFGSDIGGYREDDRHVHGRSKELFLRWAQLGAFCPVMENGGGGEHRPWAFDEQACEIYRGLVERHLELGPYLREQAALAFSEGRSVMGFLDRETYRFTLGSDLFVAPILEPGTRHEVAFPQGADWIWLYGAHERFEGGQRLEFEFPLATYPAYVRAGSGLEREWLPDRE